MQPYGAPNKWNRKINLAAVITNDSKWQCGIGSTAMIANDLHLVVFSPKCLIKLSTLDPMEEEYSLILEEDGYDTPPDE